MSETESSRAPRDSYVTAPETAAGRRLLDFLVERFPRIDPAEWRRRLAAGLVQDDQGRPLPADWVVAGQQRFRYRREVSSEPLIPFEEAVLFEDERLMAVDKPPFVPVTPSGPWVNESLLYRLMRRTGCADLAPLHRLDRETAGVVLFSKDPLSRTAYGNLFLRGRPAKRYEAVAPVPPGPLREWEVASRIEKGEPWFRMAETEGPPNARTRIRLADESGGWGLYDIEPLTGKQHQIRLHMARIGAPIRHDWLYPALQSEPKAGTDNPLQLLARELAFVDPVTGESRRFRSGFRLEWPPPVSPGA